jgi:hypothetical protein
VSNAASQDGCSASRNGSRAFDAKTHDGRPQNQLLLPKKKQRRERMNSAQNHYSSPAGQVNRRSERYIDHLTAIPDLYQIPK